ncbi:MAG: preprotein translocase subunit SecG [Patescibacteria group bacterium]|jgi:protein translocase SecG subunit
MANVELILPFLPYAQIILAVLLVIVVLLQRRGSDVGGAFGGNSGGISYAKRGIERSLFRVTVTLGILFAAVSLARVLL